MLCENEILRPRCGLGMTQGGAIALRPKDDGGGSARARSDEEGVTWYDEGRLKYDTLCNFVAFFMLIVAAMFYNLRKSIAFQVQQQHCNFGIIDRLERSVSALARLDETMKAISENTCAKGKELGVIYLLLQYEAFGLFGDASLLDIASYLEVKLPQTRKYLASLKNKGICKKVNSYNPVTFALTSEFNEQFKIEHLLNFD